MPKPRAATQLLPLRRGRLWYISRILQSASAFVDINVVFAVTYLLLDGRRLVGGELGNVVGLPAATYLL